MPSSTARMTHEGPPAADPTPAETAAGPHPCTAGISAATVSSAMRHATTPTVEDPTCVITTAIEDTRQDTIGRRVTTGGNTVTGVIIVSAITSAMGPRAVR